MFVSRVSYRYLFGFLLLNALLLAGCSHSVDTADAAYSSLSPAEDAEGVIGYRNKKMADNAYWIKSRAIGVLNAEAVALKHAADLALADGYDYFSLQPISAPLWTARFDDAPPYAAYVKQTPRYYARPEIEVEVKVTLHRGELPTGLGVYDAAAVAKYMKYQ